MNRLLLTLMLTATACRADTRHPYTLGQEKCEKVLIHAGMVMSVCELSVGFERTCYITENRHAKWGAMTATPCKFYDEVVRSPKIVR